MLQCDNAAQTCMLACHQQVVLALQLTVSTAANHLLVHVAHAHEPHVVPYHATMYKLLAGFSVVLLVQQQRGGVGVLASALPSLLVYSLGKLFFLACCTVD